LQNNCHTIINILAPIANQSLQQMTVYMIDTNYPLILS